MCDSTECLYIFIPPILPPPILPPSPPLLPTHPPPLSLPPSLFLPPSLSLSLSRALPRRGSKSPMPTGKRVKEQRKWDGAVSAADAEALNYSIPPDSCGSHANGDTATNGDIDVSFACLKTSQVCILCACVQMSMVGKMKGELQQLDSNLSPPTSNSSPGETKASKTNR